MKKAISLILAVMMLCTLSVSAFAANITTTGDATKNLTVTYSAGKQTDTYAASIEWEAMEFTYKVGGQTWNTEDLKWDDNGDTPTWSDAKNIKVINKSSTAINVDFSFAAAADAKGVTGITVNGTENLAGYTVGDATSGTAQMKTFAIQPVGQLSDATAESAVVGTITVTLS